MVADVPTQAAQYRKLAEEIRTLVLGWNDPETRAALARMAACYERLADFMDKKSKRRQPQHGE